MLACGARNWLPREKGEKNPEVTDSQTIWPVSMLCVIHPLLKKKIFTQESLHKYQDFWFR